MDNNLIKDFEKSLLDNFIEITEDTLELGVDSFIDDGVLKDFPIVNNIVSVLKIGRNVHDINLLKNSLRFIKEFNDNTISREDLIVYKTNIENNPKKCEEELGRIILLLNIFIDKEKSIWLSRIFKAYVNRTITWSEFCEYSEIINRIFIQDVELFKSLRSNSINLMDCTEINFRIERLQSLGLVSIVYKSLTYKNITDGEINTNREISVIGNKFYSIVFE